MFLFNFNSCNNCKYVSILYIYIYIYIYYLYIYIYILIYFQNNKNNVDYNLKKVILILHLKS